ncbi:hypothetical protein [Streptomyces chartreusis]|uniref:hypothetical protein n=1 Tax=Streptomyces chartreusis TaxID=1969 RepID=UPI002F9121C1|nr:hypothetical protein OG938_44175 [Streptomyces chartreusis]WSZ73447.1 hypothetical protein OG938_47620 [Streptomyces chartreusis]
MITVTPGDARDEAMAKDLLWRLRLTHPQITQIWADSAYSRDLLPAWTADHLWLTLRLVLRLKGTKGFVVLPRRWKGRTVDRLDHERPPQLLGLRTSAPALRSPPELGVHHPHAPATDPRKPAQHQLGQET